MMTVCIENGTIILKSSKFMDMKSHCLVQVVMSEIPVMMFPALISKIIITND